MLIFTEHGLDTGAVPVASTTEVVLARDKEKHKAWKVNKAKERREHIDNIKLSQGCQICGYNTHPQALSFDHIDPFTKRSDYSAKNLTRWSDAILAEELTKCRVLCLNCHMVETAINGHSSLNKTTSLLGAK